MYGCVPICVSSIPLPSVMNVVSAPVLHQAANRLDSPHVMRFLGFVRDPVRGLGLVMPRMRGSLQELVLVPDGPDPSQRVLFAHLCGMSVMALHEMGVCHQDIKSHNFLYDGGCDTLDQCVCVNSVLTPGVLLTMALFSSCPTPHPIRGP